VAEWKAVWPEDRLSAGLKVLDPHVAEDIERDIDRTFPRHVMFEDATGQGQQALRRVLLRYAVIDRDVGYCQGLAFIAALLLTYMPEDDALFSVAAVLHSPAQLRGMYLPGMDSTQRMLYVYTKLGEHFMPQVWNYFDKCGIHCSMFMTGWVLPLFCRGFGFDITTRVWDILSINRDMKIVYRVALALVKSVEAEILESDFEQILALFRELPTKVDAERLFKIVFSINLHRDKITALEEVRA
jgi:hypothetical protein